MNYFTNKTRFLISTITIVFISITCWYTQQAIPPRRTSGPFIRKVATFLDICERCSKPLRKVNGRYGEFLGCSGYPDCKYIKRKKASFACPQCAAAVEEKKWKGGTMWSCTRYPECRFGVFSEIEDVPCPKCHKSPYLLKKINNGKPTLSCPNKKCSSNNPNQKTS